MIEIISGIAIDSRGPIVKTYSPKDGPIELDSELEALWVAQGAAKYVTAGDVVEACSDDVEEVATEEVQEAAEDEAGDYELPEVNDDVALDYADLKLDQIKQELDDRGIKYAKRAKKEQLVALLRQSDMPPEITAQEVE